MVGEDEEGDAEADHAGIINSLCFSLSVCVHARAHSQRESSSCLSPLADPPPPAASTGQDALVLLAYFAQTDTHLSRFVNIFAGIPQFKVVPQEQIIFFSGMGPKPK